ncbi:MAG: pyrroloquinoline quinone-dependent dehydrogenase, partial [Gemmatimonadota bacterium]
AGPPAWEIGPSLADWTAYGRDPGFSRYSPAEQITRRNVAQMEVAWVYRTGDYVLGDDPSRFEATPLLVDRALYVSTPFGRVIALDPETGAERWSYDPGVDLEGDFGDFANRGVATWLDLERAEGERCRRRIFVAPIDARLVALDALTGRPCGDFGRKGQVDLSTDLVNAPGWLGEYAVTSPPLVVHDLVVVGSAIADNQRVDAPSGVVRAFDARTGKLRWRWDPIPRDPAVAGHETWEGGSAARTGGANVWSLLSADPERDLVFLPVGSASPDFYGGERLGQNLYANSLVALRASTGELVWHFQAVHHDLWDYDLPAQPVLVTLRRGGEEVPAAVQGTKMGHVFVLHRETGRPLFPVEERPVPASPLQGETAWPTQPFPTAPPPLVPQQLEIADAWGVSPADRAACRRWLGRLRSDGIFTPPSLEGTVIVPGNIGGVHWGGVSVDPERGILVTPTNRIPFVVTLLPRDRVDAARRAHPDAEISEQAGTPYAMMRQVLRAPSGVPCSPPPWGALTAVELAGGRILWETPLGYLPDLAGTAGHRRWGSLNLGGALVTAGGLVFIAATYDRHLRAFDIETGRELWAAELPAAGNALPMTYRLSESSRQYVVIAAGGHGRFGSTVGDYVVAFALPRERAPAAPPPAAVSFAGTYAGQIIVGRQRFPATLRVRQDGGTVSGDFAIKTPKITGTLRGRASGGRLELTIAFRFPERGCEGVVAGIAELANSNTLLVGDGRVTGSCTEREESATLAFRRR